MLKRDMSFDHGGPHAPMDVSDEVNIANVIRMILREWQLIVGATTVCLVLALVYVLTATPIFTATATLIVDNNTSPYSMRESVVPEERGREDIFVDSQIELLRSQPVALDVVNRLKLDQDEAFADAGKSPLSQLASAVRSLLPQEESDEDAKATATDILLDNLDVERTAKTLILEVRYSDPSPKRAATIANTVASSYLKTTLDSNAQSVQLARAWLQERLTDVQKQAREADAATQNFRIESRLTETSSGTSLNQQQLTDLNTRLVAARSQIARSKARLDQIAKVQSSPTDAAMPDELRNDVINGLREEYLKLQRQEAELARRVGSDHAATAQLRSRMGELEKSIKDELNRIAGTFASQYEIDKSSEAEISRSLEELRQMNEGDSQAEVQLRQLESTANLYRQLAANIQQKLLEANQQQSLPIPPARVVAEALPPPKKSKPRSLIILVLAGGFGGCAGVALVILREAMNRSLRSVQDVETAIGSHCFGVLPRLGRTVSPRTAFRHVVDKPFTRFSETIQGIKVSIELDTSLKVIGVISSIPGEGKTTVAANLAQLFARSGHSTILIDCDLRKPQLTRGMMPEAKRGMLDLQRGTAEWEQVVRRDPTTGLIIVPARGDSTAVQTPEILSSEGTKNLLSLCSSKADYTILDLPPLIPVPDVSAIAPLVDGFVMVAEWGRTDRDAVLEALSTSRMIRHKLLGIVLNNAPASALRRREAYKGSRINSYYLEGAS